MRLMKFAASAATVILWAGGAVAQDAPPPTTEAQPAPAETLTATGPEWWAFSRGAQRNYLIDVNSVVKTGDELTLTVARVPKEAPAGDYSHTVDQFGIRCQARQSHVVTSSDAMEDGVAGEPFSTDEPWEAIAADSFDDAIRDIGCDDMRPQGPSYPTVKAYIDAGRP